MFLRSKIVYKLLTCIIAIVIVIIIYTNMNDGENYHDRFVSVQQVFEDFGVNYAEPVAVEKDVDVKDNYLVNLTNFQYVISNTICQKYHRELLGVIIVTSYVGHDELRSAHRQAISQNQLNDMGFIRVFLLAEIPQKEKYITQFQIINEQKKFGDLVQGNFLEAYRNLTYKHIMGLKWIAKECKNAKFIVKADDDIVFDIFHIKNYLKSLEIEVHPKTFMAGFILNNQVPIRLSANKWFVSIDEFPGNLYPNYLSGWLYITNTPTAIELIKESQKSPFFWIDDTLVTGILRDKRNVSIINLNSWFSSNSEFIDCCVRDLKESLFECEYFVGPNGGDSKLIISFLHGLKKCYFDECIKRSPEKTLKQTCVAEHKNLLQNHGEALIRTVGLR